MQKKLTAFAELRQRARVGLRELAREAAMDPAHLSKLEGGGTVPRAKTLQRVLIALRKLIEQSPALRKSEQRVLAREVDALLNADHQMTALSGQLVTHLQEKYPDTFEAVRKDFEALLFKKGLSAGEVADALHKMSPDTMWRVVNGVEPLHIREAYEVSQREVDRRRAAGEEVHQLVEMQSSSRPFGSSRTGGRTRKPANKRGDDGDAQRYLQQVRDEFQSARRTPAPRPQRRARIAAGQRARIEVRGSLSASQREQLGHIAQLIETLLKKEP